MADSLSQTTGANTGPTGVFISHINEEAPVALVLKRYLGAAFGADFPIFVSSDKESIEAGDEWYQRTIKGLTGVKTVIVLLSQESARRGWINFEAGVGRGANAKVIPMVLNRYSLSQVPFPLAGLQGRRIDDLGFVIDSIAKREGLSQALIDIDAYHTDIRLAEAELNYRSLLVTPTMNGQTLEFDIVNVGNIDLELLMLEALVQPTAVAGKWTLPNNIDILGVREIKGIGYRVYAVYSPRGTLNIAASLRPVITPSMGRYHPQFGLRLDYSAVGLQDMRIYYQVHAVGYTTQLESRFIHEIG